MNGLPYYKAYPRDFIEGTVGMPFEIKAAYRLVLDLIYMQNGELPDDDRYISGALNMSLRKWRKIRLELLSSGKVVKVGDILTNARADKEISETNKMREKNAENARQPKKNRDLTKAIAERKQSETSSKSTVNSDKRGTRIDQDFSLTPERVATAKKIGMDQAQIVREFDQFKDYWISTPGQKGVKLCWDATWRNWCRNSLTRRGHVGAQRGNQSGRANLYSGI